MDENENAYFDYLAAREAALAAAVGSLVTDNVPIQRVQVIADTTTDPLIRLAARIVLYRFKGQIVDVRRVR